MNFQQILLVLKREYLTKIRSKAFILATLLLPIGVIAFFGLAMGIMLWESETSHTVGIHDNTGTVMPRLQELNAERYADVSQLSEDSLRSMVIRGDINGYIILTGSHIAGEANPELVYGGSGGIKLQSDIRSDLREAVRQERIARANVSEDIQKIYESRVELNMRKLTAEGEETEDNTGFFTALGTIMGVIIFGSLFGYGGYLTRSVIEEKTNRIVEIIASSVRPIELLLGKMAGIGALALTQIGFWILAFLGISAAAVPFAGMLLDSQQEMAREMASQAGPVAGQAAMDPTAFQIPEIAPSIFIYFIIFFLLGYLIYSSLFAAIGSAVDSETDTQQFMFPIMIPIMLAYFIMFQATGNPDGTLAVVGSLIPFFSPIVMITRIAITDVPFWQIGLSIVLMIGTFAGTMWLSAKIYSVGILSYGKSASFRELMKWIRHG